jgi:gamma-glutamyltranspeptidase / glutathione hydrolase
MVPDASTANQPLPRTRPVVAGLHGAVAAAHPLASQAGLDMLRYGGNAVDAAIAMAAALGVVEPYMSGPGGVGFLLLHRADGPPAVLNYSGNTPAAAKPEQFTPEAQERGSRACLIPGNVAGWFEALARHGSLPPARVFAPAIAHARDGFPLHPANVKHIETGLPRLNDAGTAIFAAEPPRIGGIVRQPDLAATYERLVERGPDEFYRGETARRIVDHMRATGGLLTADDLAGYRPEWQEPISVDYRGLSVRTCPPNCEGFQMLQTLRLLDPFDLKPLGHNSAEYIHLLSEAVKLAVADRIRWAGDPKFAPVPLDRLLADDYIAGRRKLINRQSASRSQGERWMPDDVPTAIPPGSVNGMTTHLAAVDAEGNVASITQSLGGTFGSGVFVPGTGVALNNFIFWCEIDPRCPTPNLIAPGKRWACCMAPLHVLRDGRFWISVSTPGSYGILHTTLQMLLNIVAFGADAQAAIEAPRFRVYEGARMQIEDRVPEDVRQELTRRGHALEPIGDYSYLVGGGQAVMIDPHTGARLAGADPRRDGYALAY